MPLVVGLAARLLFGNALTNNEIIGPIAVDSTNVESISYDKAQSLLYVTFIKSGEYVYKGVSEDVFRAFLDAPSKGGFVHDNLIDRYPYDRI